MPDSPDESLAGVLRALEGLLLSPAVRGSFARAEALLAADCLEIGSSGCVYDRDEILAALAAAGEVRIEIRDFEARMVSADIALASYRSVKCGPGGGETHALRSSLWRRKGEEWELVFHQGTPVEVR